MMANAALEKYRDIFDKKAFAHVATIGASGGPHATPVWVDFDGTHVRFNTARGRVKHRNLQRNPKIALAALPTTRIDTCRCAAARS